MSSNRLAAIALLVLIIFTANVYAQNPSTAQPAPASSVTGSITSEGAVRMIAHGEALQIRMEIYSAVPRRLATLEQLMLGQVQQQQTPKLH